MPLFIIAITFAHHEKDMDFNEVLEYVGVPELWIHFPLNMNRFDRSKMEALIDIDIWGDGSYTIPHYTPDEICSLRSSCEYILGLDITESDIRNEGLDDDYIEEFHEFIESLGMLISLCDRAIAENLVMAFISE